MAQRKHYWSCSKFANWLRGTDKPGAQTGDGWRRWHKQAKSAHRFRYWLAEEGLHFMKFCSKYELSKISEYAESYSRWLNTEYTGSLTVQH